MGNYQFIDDLFLLKYPNGLNDQAFIDLSKKHKSSYKILEIVKNEIDLESFVLEDTYHINKNISLIIKIVTRSSMISVFEKVAFKHYLEDSKIHSIFLNALYHMLKDFNEDTMNEFVYVLNMRKVEINRKVATWPLITFFLIYFDEYNEVFIKPTTIKRLAKLLECDIKYESMPNYMTYQNVKKMVLEYKKQSKLVKNENNLNVQAIMYCALEI
ncbi:hypothetical protein OKW23_000742 [Bacilli bacterium PM5-9]|nr:hypothetical protein [Bacilli bacterium PM5-9]